MIRPFAQMMLPKDKKIQGAMKWFAEDERQCRCIKEDAESKFMN
jgi:hypothetical protein